MRDTLLAATMAPSPLPLRAAAGSSCAASGGGGRLASSPPVSAVLSGVFLHMRMRMWTRSGGGKAADRGHRSSKDTQRRGRIQDVSGCFTPTNPPLCSSLLLSLPPLLLLLSPAFFFLLLFRRVSIRAQLCPLLQFFSFFGEL